MWLLFTVSVFFSVVFAWQFLLHVCLLCIVYVIFTRAVKIAYFLFCRRRLNSQCLSLFASKICILCLFCCYSVILLIFEIYTRKLNYEFQIYFIKMIPYQMTSWDSGKKTSVIHSDFPKSIHFYCRSAVACQLGPSNMI